MVWQAGSGLESSVGGGGLHYFHAIDERTTINGDDDGRHERSCGVAKIPISLRRPSVHRKQDIYSDGGPKQGISIYYYYYPGHCVCTDAGRP